jgi:hypothetical protein
MNTKINWALGMVCGLGISTLASASSVILNEYNAVPSTKTIGKTDSYFGNSYQGNGGNWFELVVTKDHLDMTGWTLNWKESGKSGVISLSNNSFWSDMRKGVILTIIENQSSAGKNTDTDTSLNYTTDWWANICTLSEQNRYNNGNSNSLLHTTYTTGGGNKGDFTTSNDGWQLQILDDNGTIVMDWTGEGIYPTTGVGSDEVFKLQADPSAEITPTNKNYSDGSSSTFGSANSWTTNGVSYTQNFSVLRTGVVPEPATLIFLAMGVVAGMYRRK